MRPLISLALCVFALAYAVTAQQVPLPGNSIPQFVDPLPIPNIIAAGSDEIHLNMWEFKSNVLPSGFFLPNGQRYSGTWTWGYIVGPKPAENRSTYIGPVIVVERGTPTQVRYTNNLGDTSTSHLLAWVAATDQTLHWADPLHDGASQCAEMSVLGQLPEGECAQHYSGPIPAVTHLHGGEVPPVLDGGPDAWFTSDGLHRGPAFYTHPAVAANANEAVYRYPNTQEAAPIWFHDHTLGATRLNVYAGLAGAYLITDEENDPPNLPPLIPLVIQDRLFDTNGQLFFPNMPLNPEHPFWMPEFSGDTIVVNGKAWPHVDVEAKRYRFVIINGSNSRPYELFLTNPATKKNGPAIWQIGTDGGYLDRPVKIAPNLPEGRLRKLLLLPGERAHIIIDFAGFEGELLVRNTAPTPFPLGDPVDESTTGRVLQFRVKPVLSEDSSYNPATLRPLRKPMVRLVNAASGRLAPGVTVSKIRQLTLNELTADPTVINGVAFPGGPEEILVNNTEWNGTMHMGPARVGRSDFIPVTIGGVTNFYSETPNEGETELWEFVNLTADAHPIHLHLTQFQLLNRQNFNIQKYETAYEAAFPGGAFIGGFGPPLDYNTGNPRALGGNPDITPFLQVPKFPPNPNEAGWKDTIVTFPGQVTRIVVRFASNRTPVNGEHLAYPFDPNAMGFGYVWHCHIIDHEDNEMMRPYKVNPIPDASRTYLQGVDY